MIPKNSQIKIFAHLPSTQIIECILPVKESWCFLKLNKLYLTHLNNFYICGSTTDVYNFMLNKQPNDSLCLYWFDVNSFDQRFNYLSLQVDYDHLDLTPFDSTGFCTLLRVKSFHKIRQFEVWKSRTPRYWYFQIFVHLHFWSLYVSSGCSFLRFFHNSSLMVNHSHRKNQEFFCVLYKNIHFHNKF